MGRAPCCDKNGLKKGPWTPEEDLKLANYIQIHGPGNWRTLPKNAGLERCGKSCRLRWTNYLRPDIKRGRFSFEEEETIIQLQSVLGNKWSVIAGRLPGRTDNEIKNYWNTHIRRRLLRNGIDPVTHTPRLDLLDLSSILTSAALINPSLLNLSTLLSNYSQALLNPQLFNLISTLSSLKQENPSTNFQQFSNHSQIQNQAPELLQQNHEQFQILCLEGFDSSTQWNSGEGFPSTSQGNVIPSDWTDILLNQNSYSVPELIQENYESLQCLEQKNYQNIGFDSVISTPSSSSPIALNSTTSSTYMNRNSTDDIEKESYCSNLFKFEIPESWDINDFM